MNGVVDISNRVVGDRDVRAREVDATASLVEPVSGTPTGNVVGKVDLGILEFTVPAAGVYTLRLTATIPGEYGLVVTDRLTFDTEINDQTSDPLRSLDDTLGGCEAVAEFRLNS